MSATTPTISTPSTRHHRITLDSRTKHAYEDNEFRNPQGKANLTFVTGDLLQSSTGYELYIRWTDLAGEIHIEKIDNSDGATDGTAEGIDLNYGRLVVKSTGEWSYELDNANSAVNAKNSGQSDLQECITFFYRHVTSTESDEDAVDTVNITLHGANDQTDYQNPPTTSIDSSYNITSDVLFGHNEHVQGGPGSDVMNGTEASNIFHGNGGDDWLFGEGGHDVFYVDVRDGGVHGYEVVIDGGTGNNELMFNIQYNENSNTHTDFVTDAAIHFDLDDDGTKIRWRYNNFTQDWESASPGDDDYEQSDYLRVWVDADHDKVGMSEADTNAETKDRFFYVRNIEKVNINGSSKNDTITTGEGNDKINAYGGTDVLDGGVGDDTYVSTQTGRPSSYYSLQLNLEDNTRWKYSGSTWVSSDPSKSDYDKTFTHIRVWYDLDNDGYDNTRDEFDYIYRFDQLDVWGGRGNVFNHITGSDGDDIIRTNDVRNNIFDGGDGNDTYYRHNSGGGIIDYLMKIRWTLNDNGSWEKSTSHSINDYIRIYIDRNYNYRLDETDHHTSITNFENFHIVDEKTNNNYLLGADGDDKFIMSGGDDVIVARGGDDLLAGGRGSDTLTGGAGRDEVRGGRDDDFFVLYQGAYAKNGENVDIIYDFSSNNTSGKATFNGTAKGGNDEIRLYIDGGLARLRADVTAKNDDDYDLLDALMEAADINIIQRLNDTVIVDKRGEIDSDLMILKNFPALTISHFDVIDHPIGITGASVAYEDNTVRDPSGRVAFKNSTKTGYTLVVRSPSDDIKIRKILEDNTDVELEYGTLTMNLDGNWSYELDNNNSMVQARNSGETLTEWVTVYFTNFDVEGLRWVYRETVNRSFGITIHGASETNVLDNTSSSLDLVICSDSTPTSPKTLKGGSGNDVIKGAAGQDTIYGNGGDDWITGGAGDDTFHITIGEGNDVIDGGGGVNDALYFNQSNPNGNTNKISIDLNEITRWKYNKFTQSWDSVIDSSEPGYDGYFHRIWVNLDGDESGDSEYDKDDEYHFVKNIERLIVFHGSSRMDTIVGGPGNDKIYGHGDDDRIGGGA
ncbi:MAG: VCBS domain-containing protein, partial [Parvularculales bacterium]